MVEGSGFSASIPGLPVSFLSLLLSLLLSLFCGAYLRELFRAPALTLALSRVWEIVLGAVVTVSLLSVLLLEFGEFTPLGLTCALAGLLFVLVIALRRPPSVVLSGGRITPAVLLLLILPLAGLLRFPGWSYYLAGQDQGVYVSIAHHLAREGRIPMRDPVLPLLSGSEREWYIEGNYRAISRDTNTGRIFGSYQPGVYISDLEQNEFVPQFYHLHPIWLAIGEWFFGEAGFLIPLGLFGIGSVLTLYLIGELFAGAWCGIAAALLLAISPAHSYFSKFPVAEIPAGFFFLSGLYLLLRNRDRFSLTLGSLAFGCFFFTRITGFFLLPVLLCWFVFALVRQRTKENQRRLLVAGTTIALLFFWSFLHGLAYSRPYSIEVYARTVHLPRIVLSQPLFGIALALVVLFALTHAALRFGSVIRRAAVILSQNGFMIWGGMFLALGCYLGWKGYLLGFTDHYLGHRWFDLRWSMVGLGFDSVTHLSIFSLILFLTPVGFALFGLGLFSVLRRSVQSERAALIGWVTLSYFLVLTVAQLSTPYLYYYGRYQVSELLPLALVVSMIGLFRWVKRGDRKVRGATAGLLILTLVLPSLRPAIAHTNVREAEGFSNGLKRIALNVPRGSVVFIDERHLAPEHLVLPLREIFGYLTYSYSLEKMPIVNLRRIAESFRAKGIKVYFLTHAAQQGRLPFLSKVDVIPVNYRLLLQSSRYSLPTETKLIRFALVLSEYRAE